MPPQARVARRPSARQKLLAAADELFYAEGVQSVGIDRIIEHAGVAKASLYNTFGSKEALVQAYLAARHAGTTDRLTEAIAQESDPARRLLAVFRTQGELFAEPGFRGCAFVTASAGAPPGGVVEQAADQYRAWIRALFTGLARDAGARDPEALAAQLQVIYDGAGLSARMDHDASIAESAAAAAAALLAAATDPSSPSRNRGPDRENSILNARRPTASVTSPRTASRSATVTSRTIPPAGSTDEEWPWRHADGS